MNRLILLFLFAGNFLQAQVAPLVSTTWNQGCYYNAACPVDAGGPCGRVYTGCQATAAAQLMNYYNYPASGFGSHTYTPAGYATQSVNFGAATYNWAAMPNTLSSANAEVAQLMYHIGVGVEMGYGASGSYSGFNSSVFKEHFKYSLSIRGMMRAMYTAVEWENLVKNELDNGRPVFASGGSHFYIIDGYQTAPTLRFHCNFGWGGLYDGYYDIHNVVAASLTLTPGNLIIGIKPLTELETTSDTLTVSAGGGLVAFEISSFFGAWTAGSNQTWLTLATASGTTGYYNYLSGAQANAASNASYTDRYATVTVTDGITTKSFVVKQTGIAPYLMASPNMLTYSSASSAQPVNISCDSAWTATTADTWITIAPASGSGNGSISITVAVNPNATNRNGAVIITRGSLSMQVNITQAGNASFWCTPSMVTPNSNGITNVTLNTLSYTSVINEGYVYTGMGTTLKRDSSYTIYVTFSGGNAPAVWIDWNIDGDFNDAGEAVVAPASTWYPSFTGTKNMTFTVPSAAVEGTTRMRVYAKAFGTGPVTGPCNTGDNGGCIEDYDITVIDHRMIAINPNALVFTAPGNTQAVSVTSDSAWVVTNPAAWLTVSPMSGSGNMSVNVTATANTLLSARSATVTFTRGNRLQYLGITQDGADTVLSVTPSSLTYPNTGNVQQFSITSNAPYTVTATQAWIVPNVSSGSGNLLVDVAVNSNPTSSVRTGSVIVTSGSFSQIVTISQDSTSSMLNVTPGTLTFNEYGDAQTASITTTGSWTASASDAWITMDVNSGTGNTIMTVSCDTNTAASSRSGSITITNGIVSQVIVINQDPAITTSMEALSGELEIRVFPNPANEEVQLVMNAGLQDATLHIYDATGNRVDEVMFRGTTLEYATTNLSPGIYFFAVSEKQTVVSRMKVVIAR